MAIYTNKYDLSPTLFKALTADKYKKVGWRSVSELASPVQKVILEERHANEIVIDASENFWLLMGNALHYYLAHFDVYNAVREETLTHEFVKDGTTYVISGTSDIFYGSIDDYKVTKAYVFIYGVKDEWEAQLNQYAFLWREAGFNVDSLHVQAILRDWDRYRAEREKDYPKIPFLKMDVNMWTHEGAESYMMNRINAFIQGESLMDHALPECTDKERWQRKTTYALMKKGRKTAVRVMEDRDELEEYWKKLGYDTHTHSIVTRKGSYERCKHYCNAAPFCHQLVREKEGA